jgi:hypothetical protein
MKFILDAGDYTQLADSWKRAPDITRAELLTAIEQIDETLHARLQRDPKDGGLPRGANQAGLRGSVLVEEQAFDDNVVGAVFTAQSYAPYVELGTGPHWMPVQPLLDWVKVKFGLLDAATEDAAYAVRASIAKHGTKANPVWQNVWNDSQDYIREQFDAAMTRIGVQLAGGAA